MITRVSRLFASVPGEYRRVLPCDVSIEKEKTDCCTSHRLVKSPLWTDHPEKMEQFAYNESFAMTTETTAEAMATMVESKEYPGGSVVKVTLAGMETIKFDDPIQASSMDVENAERFIHASNAPVKEKLALERGTQLR